MNGKDRDRSFSEVTDTLRYFNSMASSHSWCCSDHDYEDSSPSLALLGLNQLDLPLDGAATATAAAKAVAVAAAVSVDHNSSDLMDDNTSGVIYMNDARTKAASHDCKGQDPKSVNLLIPPEVNTKSVSILLTTPSECSSPNQVLLDQQPLSDPLLMTSKTSCICTRSYNRTNLLQVVNVIDNPMLFSRETTSDGVLALRADRERQRRHSTCPESNPRRGSSIITNNVRGFIQNFSPMSRSLEGSSLALSRKSVPRRPSRFAYVPEVVVSEHPAIVEVDSDSEGLKVERANRDLMAKNVQNYLILGPSTPLKDKLFTAGLLALTLVGILVLFWFQNFGPGFNVGKGH